MGFYLNKVYFLIKLLTKPGMSCPFKSDAKSNGLTKHEGNDTVTYGDYLQLDKVLNAQSLRSERSGDKVHDEMLFITTHQAFELWFKQILYELDYICEVLEAKAAGGVIVLIEQHMAIVLMRAERTHTILKFASNQFDILKTMPARAFNDFRVYLDTASGFQSVQFRRLEIQLGLDESRRVNSKPFTEALLPHEAEEIFVARSKKSLFQLVNNLLEETLAINEAGGFNFYGKLAAGFESKLSTLEFKLRQGLSIDIKKRIEEEIVMLGKFGFSSGTGGSSGVHYLSATCGTRYRIFMDLVRLNTYDIPKEVLPKLDKNLEHSTS